MVVVSYNLPQNVQGTQFMEALVEKAILKELKVLKLVKEAQVRV